MRLRTLAAKLFETGSIRRCCILLLALVISVVMASGCGGRRSAQYTQQGNTYLRLKKVVEAEQAYQKALDVDAQNKEAKLGLARCYAIEKKYDQALGAYRELTDADPSFGEAQLEAVKILLTQAGAPGQMGDNYTPEIANQVEEFVAKFEKANPEQGGMLRAFVLRQTGRIDEAVALLTKLRDQFPNSSMARVGLASAYLAANKPEQAEQELKDVLDTIEPDSVAARMTLIDVYRTQGKLPEIVEQLQQLVAQQPDDSGLKLALARSLLDSGRIDEAEAAARPVLTANPDSGWANYVVGCCLLEKGVYAEAVECLETAAHALPQEPGVINMLARARSGDELPKGRRSGPLRQRPQRRLKNRQHNRPKLLPLPLRFRAPRLRGKTCGVLRVCGSFWTSANVFSPRMRRIFENRWLSPHC